MSEYSESERSNFRAALDNARDFTTLMSPREIAEHLRHYFPAAMNVNAESTAGAVNQGRNDNGNHDHDNGGDGMGRTGSDGATLGGSPANFHFWLGADGHCAGRAYAEAGGEYHSGPWVSAQREHNARRSAALDDPRLHRAPLDLRDAERVAGNLRARAAEARPGPSEERCCRSGFSDPGNLCSKCGY